MDVAVQDEESAIRQHFERGELQAAATRAIRMYGAEIRRFFGTRLRSVPDADEAYQIFSEVLWSRLPDFAWNVRMRAWMYSLARGGWTG